jgi:hypothetical protein
LGYLYDVREGVCVYLGLYASFEAALDAAREREGEPASEDAA